MSTPAPIWMKRVLLAAAAYNLLWGAVVIGWPNLLFDLTGIDRPRYPQIWQCVGMIVGVYGVGYAAAAFDPLRHWPIVLVGLLGKVFGPLGFAVALVRGEFPWSFGLTIVTNDLVWWVPFALMLRAAFRANAGRGHSDGAGAGGSAGAVVAAAADKSAQTSATSFRA